MILPTTAKYEQGANLRKSTPALERQTKEVLPAEQEKSKTEDLSAFGRRSHAKEHTS